jgi:hypothetical protein
MLRSSALGRDARTGAARVLLVVIAGLFLLISLPVVLRGGPLRDDFDLCVSPRWNSGLGVALDELLIEQGAVGLPQRLLQVGLISGFCGEVPFGVFIAVPLVLTLGVAVLLHSLLRDLGLHSPWPEIGAALWLLQPLGTDAALWATQLDIPLGLCLVLIALRAYRRGRLWWAVIASVVAYGMVEQATFALPLAAWLVAPPEARRRVAIVASGVLLSMVAIYLIWPGTSARTAVGFSDRLAAMVTDPAWYVRFPAVGLGLHSIPVAVWWAFPFSLGVLAMGALLGARSAPAWLSGAPRDQPRRAVPLRSALIFVALALLVNVPLITTLPHQHSPRTFTPTWLLLAALAALLGSQVRWRRMRLAGGVAGLLAAGALLSIAFSVSVRVRTADFTEASSRWLAERVPDGGIAVICNVPRTAVTPAPNGDFALHELHYPWAAEGALRYYTGRSAKIERFGAYWDGRCPNPSQADLVINFSDVPHTLVGEGHRPWIEDTGVKRPR